MEQLFNSIIEKDITISNFLVIIFVGLLIGLLISLITKYKSTSTKNYFIATSILPACIAMVIMLVNGNIGAGVAVAGAFSLIRFRSATGTAREIVIIFIEMAAGLSLGMGYIGYALLFSIISVIVLFLLTKFDVFKNTSSNEMRLKIIVPEDLDYQKEFNKIFDTYLSKVELVKIKTTLMGSMFQLSYDVELKDLNNQKQMIDEIRCKNSNLEVLLEKHVYEEKDL